MQPAILSLADLWMPIVLSAVFVFIASSVLHMATPMHKGDMKKLPGEEQALAGLRAAGVVPGDYMFPCPGSMKEMGSPEFLEKYKAGPVGTMTVLPNGPPNMGKALGLWFVWTLVVGVFVAYLTSLSQSAGAPYMHVFRVAGTVAILGYAFSNVTNSIWKGVSWGTTFKFVVDGVIYGLVTAGTFAWLWPAVN